VGRPQQYLLQQYLDAAGRELVGRGVDTLGCRWLLSPHGYDEQQCHHNQGNDKRNRPNGLLILRAG
jgi:hypothetical protein